MSLKLTYPVGTPNTRSKLFAYRGNPEEVLAALRDIGYSGVELAVRDPEAMDAGEFRRIVERCGFEVAAVGTGPMVGEDKHSSADKSVIVNESLITFSNR